MKVSMASVHFKQVDVFTSVRFNGNPVAVVLQADMLSTRQMQQIANWTNLSETTFVVPATDPGADYHVRIFTPNAELPFAGHPTIGTAHALLEAGLIEAKDGVLVQQCGVGLVKLSVAQHEDGARWIFFDLPEPKVTVLSAAEVQELEAILGTSLKDGPSPCLVDVGARWIVVQLPSAEEVLQARPDLQRMNEQDLKGRHTGVVIFGEHEKNAQARIEVRAFAPAHGIDEDPVCGSGNGCVGAYLIHTGQTGHFGKDFLATQGAAIGRAGMIRLVLNGNAVQVGGNAITCIEGMLSV
jgi:PhzF family phenazine biosynthesis protein